jgi:hypothetical protein
MEDQLTVRVRLVKVRDRRPDGGGGDRGRIASERGARLIGRTL